jgi:tellurite resistance protein
MREFLHKLKRNKGVAGLFAVVLAIPIILSAISYQQTFSARAELVNQLILTNKSFEELKNQDQVKVNLKLKADVDRINKNYKGSIEAFQKIQDLKDQKQDTKGMEATYIAVVKSLSDLNYASAEPKLKELNDQIKKKETELASAQAAQAAKLANTQPAVKTSGGAPATAVAANNTPPGSGYSFQSVKADIGTYNVSIVAADLGSTRVIIDTASDSDCSDNCPVMSLGDYVARSGAFAGINGSYFCPASYPSCAGKTNSFDTLLMNKNKKYFNSDNNVYSNVPVAVFGSGYARFIGASSGWGRDTGVDGVIANQPLLLSGGNITFGGGSDPKQGSKGARSFVGSRGSTVYIGVVYNATVAEVAHVLKALGLDNALNLDSGGSTALWSGGYKVGPGRNIPNAILFVRR